MKKTEEEIEEEELEIRIRLEERQDFESAIESLYTLASPGLVSFLDRKFACLSTVDKQTIFNTAFLELEEKLWNGEIDLNNPLPPFLLTIAHRRAIDLIRSRSSKKQTAVNYFAEVDLDTVTDFDWERKRKRGTEDEIKEEILHHFEHAPPLAKAVAEALVSLCPPKPKPKMLKEAVDRILGKPTPLSSVESTLSRLRKDIRTLFEE